VKKHPLIAMGTPDPYNAAKLKRITCLRWEKCHEK